MRITPWLVCFAAAWIGTGCGGDGVTPPLPPDPIVEPTSHKLLVLFARQRGAPTSDVDRGTIETDVFRQVCDFYEEASYHRLRFEPEFFGWYEVCVPASWCQPLGVWEHKGAVIRNAFKVEHHAQLERHEVGDMVDVGRAERRLGEVEGPLDALAQGNILPLINSTVTTLGMFNVTGDPEWLYNIPNRPVFDLLTGAIFLSAVVLCVRRLRQPGNVSSLCALQLTSRQSLP